MLIPTLINVVDSCKDYWSNLKNAYEVENQWTEFRLRVGFRDLLYGNISLSQRAEYDRIKYQRNSIDFTTEMIAGHAYVARHLIKKTKAFFND